MAIASPLGPNLANIFMFSIQQLFLYIFVLFFTLDQAEEFQKYSSSKHHNINFTLKKENEGRLSFLDIDVFREKGKFVTTNVYRKKTFSGVYTSLSSFIPETYKTGLFKSLLFRCLFLDLLKFFHEINMLKSILYENSYPRDFVDKCIKEFLERLLTQKVIVSIVPKKRLDNSTAIIG